MKDNWIIPCNIKVFNVIEHFKTHTTAVWKNSFTIHEGDTLYIYIGAPYGQIRYKCTCVSENVSDELLQEHPYAIVTKASSNYFSKKIKYIEMKLEKEFPDGLFTLADLREHGLGQVQIQARTDRNLQKYISSVEQTITEREE